MDQGWLSDNVGRIANISLAPNGKNAMYPLFEAVMNSIQAVEERFGPDNLSSGEIEIAIERDSNDDTIGFTVRDNGAGFNSGNIESLRKFDSRKKAAVGGKGVGRLLWLKVCDRVKIVSQFQEDGTTRRVAFDFSVNSPVESFVAESGFGRPFETSITISPYKSEYATKLPKKAETIANRVLAHFISFFTNMAHPAITLIDGSEVIDLFDAFSEKVERDADYKFHVEGIEDEFVIHCFLLPKSISDDEKSVNALYLGANGRAVSRHELDSVLGMKAIADKFAFFGYVEGTALNSAANETRTAFSLEDDEIKAIVDVAKQKAKEFLAPEIAEIRTKQEQKIVEIGRQHPRFFQQAKHAKNTAESLHLSTQSEEAIFVELSRSSLRDFKKRTREFNEAYKKGLPDIPVKTQELVHKLQEDAIASLAEYVARRKTIIEVFEVGLRYRDTEKQDSHDENVVHSLIVPLRSSTDELTYEQHNLWLLDDRLAFYTYFNSDKPFSAITGEKTSGTDRPDVALFDLGLGFDSSDTTHPITIVEFKKPRRNDYTLSDNPIVQVRRYVDKLRAARKAVKFDGTKLRNIDDDTPFMCYIVADIEPTLLEAMRNLGNFTQRAGSDSFYFWDPSFKIMIEVMSYDEVLASAKARNQAFFAKLGID